MERTLADIRYAIRKLIRTPGFTLAALLSLGLGIGANTAIYSIVDAVILDPLAVTEPDRLVAVYTSGGSGTVHSNPSFPDYLDYAATDVFVELAAYAPTELSLAAAGSSQRVAGLLVTGNYFRTLGLRPAAGRLILPDDDVQGAAASVVVLAHRYWQARFGGDRDVIGSTLELNGEPFTVIGVAPQGFRGVRLDASPTLFIPMRTLPRVATGFMARFDMFGLRDVRWLDTVGRLADGVTVDEARRTLDVVASRLRQAYPESNAGREVAVEPATTAAALSGRGDLVRFVALLAGVVAFTLLIACANVANLLLSRARRRRREIAVRLAMGAARGRLVRQLLTESVVLSIAGGAAGLGFALVAFRLLVSFELPGDISIAWLELGLNGPVLLFTLAVSLMTGLVFGSIPALQASRPNLVPALKDEAGQAGGRGSRLQGVLVTAQVGLCLVLLIGAGLFIRALKSALESDLGFRPAGALAVSLDLGTEGYELEGARAFYQRLLERTRGLPGVEAAALAMVVPVSPGGVRIGVQVEGYQPGPDEDMEIDLNVVSPGYFRTLGIPLLAGRDLEDRDRGDAARVAIVNETLVRRFWPDSDPLIRRISFDGGANWVDVIGVVADGRYRGLDESPRPYIYLPIDEAFGFAGLRQMNLVARADARAESATALAPALRDIVRALDPSVPLFNVRPVEQQVRELLLPQRMGVTLLSFLGGLALVLATLGIYGVVAYGVSQRSGELGLRAALGARPSDLVRLVVRGSMLPVVAGLALGLWGAWMLSDAAEAFLYEVSPADPLTYVAVSVLLLTVALLASYVPARRATSVDPASVLRRE